MKQKFEETVQKFHHNIFGDLSIIRSQQEGDKIWFIAKEVCNILGVKNLTQSLNQADLDDDEIFVLTKVKHPKFWSDFMSVYGKKDNILKISSSNPISV